MAIRPVTGAFTPHRRYPCLRY